MVYDSLKNKNIWILVSSLGIGGAESRSVKLACYLKSLNVFKQVNLVVNSELTPALEANYYLSQWLRSHQVNVINIDSLPNKPPLRHKTVMLIYRILYKLFGDNVPYFIIRQIATNLSWRLAIKSLVSKDDIVHAIFDIPAMNAALCLATEMNNNTLIVEVTSNRNLSKTYKHPISSIFRPGITAHNLHIRCVTKTVHENFCKLFSQSFFEAHNIDVDYYAGPFVAVPDDITSADKPKKNIIIYPHRFLQPKNPLLFCEAIKDLLDHNQIAGWEIRLRGKGELEAQIIDILKPYIDSGIVKVGFSHDLFSEFSESKICVSIITTGNASSNSIYESLKYGNLQIISDTGVTKQILKHPDLYYCELSHESLKKTILQATQDCTDDSGYNTKKTNMKVLYNELLNDNLYVKEIFRLYTSD